MSEQQNVAVIRNAFEAFGRGDLDGLLASCRSDCEFYCPGPASIPYSGTKKGHSEIRRYFETIMGTQSKADVGIERFVAQGDTVVAIGRYRATVIGNGRPIDTPVVFTFDLQDGKIARHMVLGDTAGIAASYTASGF